jgi:uncharacterized protein YkwD/chitodextrinase
MFSLLIGAAGGAQSAPIEHQIALPAGMTWCSDGMINGLLTELNAFRRQNGLTDLAMDRLGMKVAETRATQFATYMNTTPPGSPGFNPHQGWDTTAASLGYSIVSENLAYMSSDPAYIVYSIWQGPLHKAAMLNTSANVAGVSCVVFNGTPYWTYNPGKAQATLPPPSGGTTGSEEAAFLTLINSYRAQNGAGPLQISPTLRKAAEWMSNDMATKNYASHTDSLGRSVGARLAAFGYTYLPYGENIAGGYGDAQTAFNQWLNACDPDAAGACTYAHRKNMLNPSFTAIGIGRTYNANSSYRWYWVTDFGGYVDGGTPLPPSTAPAIASFSANPASITAGQSATLSWSVSGATALSIDNGIGAVTGSGSRAVTPAQTTTYRLTATNNAGTSSKSVTVTVAPASTPDTQAPSAPVLTSATARSANTVELAWSASTDNIGIKGYQVLRNGSPAGSVGPTVRSFSDSVAPATTYTYAVKAFDAAGNYSAASNIIQVTTPAQTSAACPPAVEGAFTGCYYSNITLAGAPALVRQDSRIDFNWAYTRPSPAISSTAFSARWQGVFSFTPGTYTFNVTVSDGIRLYVDGALVLDRWRDQPVYTYAVRRTLTGGKHTVGVEYYTRTGSARAAVSWQNTSNSSGAPVISAFTATPSSIAAGRAVALAWMVTGATALTIDNGIGNVTNLASKQVSPASTTTYNLTATNSAGATTASVTVVVNGGTTTDTVPPTAPAITSAVARSATAVDLAWTASSDNTAVSGYRVLRNGTSIASLPSSARSYTDSGAAPSSTYTYTLQAFDAAGNVSRSSNAANVTTSAGTAAVTCTPAINAFTGCYYNNLDLSGAPVLVRTDNRINFDWRFSPPDAKVQPAAYSVRWQGTFSFQAGEHTFSVRASDGIRLYIDGTLVLDRWRDLPEYSYTIRRTLAAGNHLITVETYQRGGTATAAVSWVRNP